ncbi:MAG: N-acetylneuraminate synthase family protein [Candidatus Cloacimonetes bacterium]|nr:N-acetylneuraminate synthase family protein [Candidatus Cloacimonadota bacterium]
MLDNKPYIIGETAYNHEGDIRYLYKMIDDIAELKLNAVKYHLLLKAESYLQKKHPLVELIKKWMFSQDEWVDILNYSNDKELDVVALCDDVESLIFINQEFPNIKAIELHASGLNDYYLLEQASLFQGTVILGVGGSTLDEIQYALKFLKQHHKEDIMLMYGFQSYPTNYEDINLSKMLTLKSIFNVEIGYADHTGFDDPNNVFLSCAAATMGFNVLEKHFTPDFGKERIDYHSAVGIDIMQKIKNLMEVTLKVYGTGDIAMSEPELKYGNTGPMKKAIVARKKIRQGEILSLDHLWFKRTEEESFIKQNMLLKLIGLEACVDIDEDEIVDFSKVIYKFKQKTSSDFTNLKED